jgi:hypothetical protein
VRDLRFPRSRVPWRALRSVREAPVWFVGALVFVVTSAHAGRGALPEPLESLPLIVEDVTPHRRR